MTISTNKVGIEVNPLEAKWGKKNLANLLFLIKLKIIQKYAPKSRKVDCVNFSVLSVNIRSSIFFWEKLPKFSTFVKFMLPLLSQFFYISPRWVLLEVQLSCNLKPKHNLTVQLLSNLSYSVS